MWGSFKRHVEFRFLELDIASPRAVLEKRTATRIWLKPNRSDEPAASGPFPQGSALRSCPHSPNLAEEPCHLPAAGKTPTPASSRDPQGKAPARCQDVWQSPTLRTEEREMFYLGCFLAPDRWGFRFSTFSLSRALCFVFAHTAPPWWCTLSILLFIILNPFFQKPSQPYTRKVDSPSVQSGKHQGK